MRGLDAAQRNGIAAMRALPASFLADRDSRGHEVQKAYDVGYRLLGWLDTMVFSAAIEELLDVPR